MRFHWLYPAPIAFLIVMLSATSSACLSAPLLTGVQPTVSTISPNGDGIGDEVNIAYRLNTRANVTITLLAPDGATYLLRDRMLRSPDDYQVRFNGAVSVGGSEQRRVLPDGRYTLVITAADLKGAETQQKVEINIVDADTNPPEILEVVTQPTTTSPNGDGIDDEVLITYKLTKKATVELFVTDQEGHFHLLEARQEREAGLPPGFRWNGKENQGRLLPDGEYKLHIRAWDQAGNVSEVTDKLTLENGGTPRMVVLDAQFSPPSIPLGGVVKVRIKVKNIGDTIIKSAPEHGVGPPPGTQYATNINYAYWRDEEGNPLYYERSGTWRVGVSWTNAPTPPPFPVRWSLGKDLAPGEEVEVTGEIKVLQKTREMYFWATLVQEGVGYIGGDVGQTLVLVSY